MKMTAMPMCFRRACGAFLALATLVLWPAAAAAQTPALADVAKKEQDRRKSTPGPKKVYTSKDLPKPTTPPPAPPAAQAPGAAAPSTPAGTGDAAAGQSADAATQPGEEVKDEQWWRQQMAALRDELTRNEMFLEALQTRINSLGTDYVARDDPAQRARVAEERQRSLAMMDRVKTDIDKANKAIADLEEEARKAGVPPGWLR
jgi:hypothetical protein